MGRLPKLNETEDGSAEVRTVFGPYTWRLIKMRANKAELRNHQASKMFMQVVEALLANGRVDWLPIDWQEAHKAAKIADSGLPPSLTKIDLSVLDRSTKTKSGFVGVYANGPGFRATGRRQGNGVEYLGQFDTAEEAAYARYLHYRKNDLPYGILEEEVDRLRKEGKQGTDAELAAEVVEIHQLSGTEHLLRGPTGETIGLGGRSLDELLRERTAANAAADAQRRALNDTQRPRFLRVAQAPEQPSPTEEPETTKS